MKNYTLHIVALFMFMGTWLYSCAATAPPDGNIRIDGWQYVVEDSEAIDPSFSIRIQLPEWKGLDPVLYFKRIGCPVTVCLNSRMVFRSGEGFVHWDNLLVPLPDFFEGDTLTVTVPTQSEAEKITHNILLTSSEKIYHDLGLHNIDDLAFATIFLTAGILSLIILFIYRKSAFLAGIMLYLISLSAFIASNSSFLQLVLPAPRFYYHLDYLSLICATIGGFFAIAQIPGMRNRKILHGIWQIHLAFLMFALLILNLTGVTFPEIIRYFLILLAINIVICMTVMIKSAKAGDDTAKILIGGMFLFLLSAILEIVLFYQDADDVYSYSVKALHFGTLFSVISLLWIAVHSYLSTHRQKVIAQQKEIEAIKRENRVREQFAEKLIESQENERNRIALELHDSVGQKLLIIKNMLLSEMQKSGGEGVPKSLKQICDLSGDTIQDVRNITTNLRPRHLDQLGLTTAIETIIEQFMEGSEIHFHMDMDNVDGLVSQADEINFFRIVQESLNNIVKHSMAADAFVTIRKSDRAISTEIRDNGIGSAGNSSSVGLGITGMQERARMIGADLKIDFSPGEGTQILMHYPLKRKDDHA